MLAAAMMLAGVVLPELALLASNFSCIGQLATMDAAVQEKLSPRQLRVAEFAALGYSNAEIAAELNMTESGVKSALHQVFDRLGIWNRVELANRFSSRDKQKRAFDRIEEGRLEALRTQALLDTPSEAVFDDLVTITRFVCGTPIALLSLVDGTRQWFKSEQGLGAKETSRDASFCAHTMLGSDLMIVHDATRDERFRNNPLVTDDPHIRFYVGAPLLTEDGYGLGSICAIDRIPRKLNPEQMETLRALGRIAMRLIASRAK